MMTVKLRPALKKRVEPYLQAYHAFRQESTFVRRRRPVLFDETNNEFEKFLDLLAFYLCRECGSSVGEWHPADAEWFSGHHNGALLKHVIGAQKIDVFEGIIL